MELTIAIPTYNRPEPLLDTLHQLGRQTGIDRCTVVVFDNHSGDPVSHLLAQPGSELPYPVEVRRNPANLGLSGNILRCFEVEGDGWLWILADDDELAPDAVATIFSLCEKFADAGFVMMGQGTARSESGTEVEGIDAFADHLDDWGRITFISAGLYRLPQVRPLINVGINYGYSVVPFIAMIFVAIQEHGMKTAFDSFVPVFPKHKSKSTWTWVLSINTYTACELVESDGARKTLMRLASPWCLGPIGLTHDFAKRYSQGLSGLSRQAYVHKLHLLSQVSLKNRAMAITCHLLSMLPPHLCLRAIEGMRNVLGRGGRNERGGEKVFGQA